MRLKPHAKRRGEGAGWGVSEELPGGGGGGGSQEPCCIQRVMRARRDEDGLVEGVLAGVGHGGAEVPVLRGGGDDEVAGAWARR